MFQFSWPKVQLEYETKAADLEDINISFRMVEPEDLAQTTIRVLVWVAVSVCVAAGSFEG